MSPEEVLFDNPNGDRTSGETGTTIIDERLLRPSSSSDEYEGRLPLDEWKKRKRSSSDPLEDAINKSIHAIRRVLEESFGVGVKEVGCVEEGDVVELEFELDERVSLREVFHETISIENSVNEEFLGGTRHSIQYSFRRPMGS